MLKRGIIIYLVLLGWAGSLSAGGLDRIFFSTTGERLEGLAEVPTSYELIKPKLESNCTPSTALICIEWELISSDVDADTTLRPFVESGLSHWASDDLIDLEFSFSGISSQAGIPYELEDDNVTRKIDSFGNEIIQGPFMISFNPPPEIVFPEGVIALSKTYIVPDLTEKTGQVVWGGIFLNPVFEPNTDYNLEHTVAHEMGRIMGLTASSVRSSILFPIKAEPSDIISLKSSDALLGGAQYASSDQISNYGSLSGSVINGETGEPWVGAHLELIPEDKKNQFAGTIDRSLAIAGTYSLEEGVFKFDLVPPGRYYLLSEPLSVLNISFEAFGDWMKFFGSSESFETEFYDGSRESNLEPIFSFSPLSIYYAATLIVVAGEETSDVKVVTNTAMSGVELIQASGSTNEELSEFLPESTPLQNLDVEQPAEQESPRSRLGCSLNMNDRSGSWINLLLLIFALVPAILIRRGLTAK